MVGSDSTNAVSDCLLCGQEIAIFRESVFDTRFGIEGSYNICRCGSCGLIQLLPYPRPDELKRLYETYYNFGGSAVGTYTGLRSVFLQSLLYRLWIYVDGDSSFHLQTDRGRLLDVGCNEGRGLQIYESNGFKVEGLELNKRAATEARKSGFRVYTDPIETFRPDELYDVVVFSNVLEHSLQPKEMLVHVARILKPGGHVWISCPNVDSWQRKVFGRYWINWHVPFHIVHFSQSTLTKMLQKTGFEIQKMRQESPALWFAQSLIVKLFAQLGQPTNHLRKSLLVASLMLLARGLFFPLLALGNRLGRGDCLIIVAKKN